MTTDHGDATPTAEPVYADAVDRLLTHWHGSDLYGLLYDLAAKFGGL